MGLKSFFGVQYATWVNQQNAWWINNPIKAQKKVFKSLMSKAEKTAFGKEHGFATISSYKDFKSAVPVRDYEGLKPYIKRALDGEKDVLWKGLPLYFCKTSGTTSGTKYIPISKDSMPYHLKGAKDAILSYVYETSCAGFLNGKNIFIQGSPELDYSKSAPLGRLSGIVAHHVPWYLQRDNTPNFETNCIEEWEEKIEAIIEETISENMTLISGIPPWIQMYFERLKERTGKEIKDVFPNYSLMVYGGVNFEPYKKEFQKLIDSPKMNYVENYNASEGFFGIQDKKGGDLLLMLDYGVFYEFIPLAEYKGVESSQTLSLEEVELGENYAVVITTNGGLWRYIIGDTVTFTEKKPYRFRVTGRTKSFINSFGEELIVENAEKAIIAACEATKSQVKDYTAAPVFMLGEKKGCHEWLIEFITPPQDEQQFNFILDESLKKVNTDYEAKRQNNLNLKAPKVHFLNPGTFDRWLKSNNKLGGQHKVPRLCNDRKIIEEVKEFMKFDVFS